MPATIDARSTPFAADTLFADVCSYHAFGIHRTAHAGDQRTSAWLAERLRGSGLEVVEQPWKLAQFFVDDVSVEDAEGRIEAFPIWLPHATGTDGVRGRVEAAEIDTARGKLAGAVAWIAPRGRSAGQLRDIVRHAELSGAAAIVFVTGERTPGGHLVAQNAEREWVDRERPLPLVMIGAGSAPRLARAAASGAGVIVRIAGRLQHDATATNVIGRLDRGGPTMVVSTPSSGWFTCAGERGPGIAMLLALARFAASRDTKTSWLFAATSGHELDNLGARHLHASGQTPGPRNTLAWLHLGADIATPPWRDDGDGPRPQATVERLLLQSTAALAPIMRTAFAGLPMATLRTDTRHGEYREVIEMGYAGIGLVTGGNPYFHVPLDDPRTVSKAALAAITAATASALAAIEAGARA